MTDMGMGAPGGAEPSALTTEQLREIAEAARYVHGPADCFERECDDFYDEGGFVLDPEPEYCSHMSVRYATADDADAALWLPLMVKSLEEERDSLRTQLELVKRRAAQPPSSEASINTPEAESGRGDKQ